MRDRVAILMNVLDEPREWLGAAFDAADLEADVVLVDGIEGHMGRARLEGFRAMPDVEYWAIADPDDPGVHPGAVEAAVTYLDANPDAVSTYSDLRIVNRLGDEICRDTRKRDWHPMRQLSGLIEVHHFHVMRSAAVREEMAALEDWVAGEEYVLMAWLLRHGRHHLLPQVWYTWRDRGQEHISRTLLDVAQIAKARNEAVCTVQALGLLERGRHFRPKQVDQAAPR